MKKLSDFIFDYLYKNGIKDAFMISGGGAIHLDDSLGKGKVNYFCNHHEQASSIAAEAYTRLSGKIAVCVLTTGPGGTNAITGVMGAWLDSIPMLIISGQIKRETIGAGRNLRQLGDQEINIIDIIKPITKYAALVKNPNDIKYHLGKALYLAKNGRPGPVWLDIPLDVQGTFINETKLKSFNKNDIDLNYETDKKKLSCIVTKVIKEIEKAKRPILIVGNGVRVSNSVNDLHRLISLLRIPVLTGFAGFDLVSTENKYFAGHPGTIGQRGANFALQNSDLILAIGTRLNIRMIGYNFKTFAKDAYKIIVDIDKEELNKKTIKPDMKINFNAKDFINEMIKQLKIKKNNINVKSWIEKINEWKNKYPVVSKKYWEETNYVNPYCFIEELSKYISSKDVLVSANATPSICAYQALNFPQGTRFLVNSGCAAMGYGFPASIGACFALRKRNVICLEGDGSMQLNIQELQTVVYHKLPVKIFYFNNHGYVSIKLTQKGMFEGKFVGSDKNSGVSFPNILKIADAYGIKAEQIKNHKEMSRKIKKVLNYKMPVICEILIDSDMQFLPKSSSKKLLNGKIVSRPIHDMYPFLSKKELEENMLIK